MHLFIKYFLLIGSNDKTKSASREGAWFLIIFLGVLPFLVILRAEYNSIPMPLSTNALIFVLPSLFVLFLATHGLQKLIVSGVFPAATTPKPGEYLTN